jgi:hypothetical protein
MVNGFYFDLWAALAVVWLIAVVFVVAWYMDRQDHHWLDRDFEQFERWGRKRFPG